VAERPVLSIIVTSYTTERLADVFGLLENIWAQSNSDIEVIFVAEGSPELFARVRVYAEGMANLNLKVIYNEGQSGLSAARNLGIKQAAGDIVAFVDDDVVLLPGWAEATIKAYEDDSVIGVTGAALPLWADESMAAWLPEEFYWLIGCTAWSGEAGSREVRNGWGMNMSFRRQVFDSGEFFNPGFGLCNSNRAGWGDPPAEDVDLSLRAKRRTGKRIIYVPGAGVKHRVYRQRFNRRFIAQRSYSVGYQRRVLKKLYPEANSDNDLLNQEYQLLGRILSRLLPSILKGFFTAPVIAWRRFRITVTVLFFVTLGYCAPIFTQCSREDYYREEITI